MNAAQPTLELRAGQKVISGYAAVYYRSGDAKTEFELWPGMTERIIKGAFTRALKERQNVRALFNHNPDLVLGTLEAGTLKLTSDDRGLRYEIDPPDTAAGRDVMTLLKRKDVRGSSFGFSIVEAGQRWSITKDGKTEVRELIDLDIGDVGPVTYPAYEGTTAEARAAWEKVKRGARGEGRGPSDPIFARVRLLEIEGLELGGEG